MAGENINRRLNIYINDREIINSSRGIDREMAKVRNQIKNLNKGAADYDQQLAKLKNTYSQLQQKQKEFRDDMAQTKSILGSIKSALGPVGTGFLAAFSVAGVINKVTTGINDAWKKVVEFDQKQADLAAVMGKSRSQIAGLTIDAIKYGATTSKNASEVSELQLELAKLGKTSTEIKAMTKDVINASNALETDLASAANLVGGQLNSYGENANQAGKYSDIMANSVNLSATSYEYLATSLPKVSSVAAQNNVTFERLNATLGTLADQNIAAETAGTGFRNILLEAAKAGKPYQKMLDEVKNSSDQSKKAVELFGKENATVAVILANSTEKINQNTKALENSSGSAERLAKERLNSIKGSVEGFSGAWEGFLLNIEKGDGFISKAVRGFIDFGTSILNAITPMKKLSDQIQQEQLDLNMLVSRITSTNISNEERFRLLNQLNENYPEFTKNINIETVSNSELNKELNKVNENYIKRIALQKQVENVEDAQKSVGDLTAEKLKYQEKLYKFLNELKIKYKLPVQIDFGNLEKSASEIRKRVAGKEFFGGEVRTIDTYTSYIKAFNTSIKEANKELDDETSILIRQQKYLGINTEAQNEANKALAEQAEILKKLRLEAKGLGMKNADTSTEQELKIWLAAYKEKLKYTGELSEEEKKKRARELEEAKKHSEELLKEYQQSQKKLLDAQRSLQDVQLASQKESYEKERKELNLSYDRKIEDTKIKQKEIQSEIDKLTQEKKDPKNSKSDVALLQKQIDAKLELQKIYNKISISLEEERTFKLATLQNKYLQKEIDEREDAHNKALKLLKERQDYELAGINTLEEAKAVLQNYLDEKELKNIKSLEDAKRAIKEQHLKEEYAVQEAYLIDSIAKIQALFAQEDFTGVPILTEEERAALLAFLDEAAIKLANLKNGKKNVEGTDTKDISTLSGIDILGFNPEQWQSAFDNLDTWAEKLEAVGTVIGGIKNAFGMYFQFLEAGDKRSLQKFEANNKKKQKELALQLEKGYITQEVYNARKEKLDQDLARKQAELEYKQAKREKLMNIANIIGNNAMAVSKALAQGGFIFGIPWAAIVGALGAVQLAAALAQPLPPKNPGFRDGGYTGDGPDTGVAGDAHFQEYVTPRKVLFSNDPLVPSIIGYLEAKRTGKVTATSSSGNYSPPIQSITSPENLAIQQKTNESLDKLNILLEKLGEGIPAYLENDLRTAKKIRRKLNELQTLENQTKS